MSEFKVNDSAYFIEPWTGNIIGGQVLEVKQTEAKPKYPSEPYLVIQIEGTRYGKRDFLASKCYPTREAADVAQAAESEKLRDKYRSQIQGSGDLVRFMYEHNVSCCEEYTDWEARAVAKEKAKEIFGLELE